MVINTNISAQSSARLLAQSSTMLSKSLARLSSGSKISSPEEDVAGLSVSMKFDAQITRIGAAITNISNAISFCQTQDGYLQKVGDALNRMSELAIMAQDVTKSDGDRDLYQKEFDALGTYINDLAGKDFNGVSLFDGQNLLITTDSDSAKYTMNGITLGGAIYTAATTDADLTTDPIGALEAVKQAITQLATDRATEGASVASLTAYSDQLGVLKDKLSAANSQIKDVDVASESTKYARYSILVQAGTAMLAQANVLPQSVLKLLS
ncbi:MAG TPA: flagellin [Clostridia bacterium]|nr:flagellin [Clostridia bacterium]